MQQKELQKVNSEDSVDHARLMAAKMNAELNAGVEQAEALKI